MCLRIAARSVASLAAIWCRRKIRRTPSSHLPQKGARYNSLELSRIHCHYSREWHTYLMMILGDAAPDHPERGEFREREELIFKEAEETDPRGREWPVVGWEPSY